MAKTQTLYACSECGATTPKWLGRCPDCGSWNTLLEESSPRAARGKPSLTFHRPPEFLAEIDGTGARMKTTGIPEFDRVTGGGLVAGSVVLLGGEPGIGKSTLVLQVADQFGRHTGPVLYASGEESAGQIKRRAERLSIRGDTVALLSTTELETIAAAAEQMKPALLIVDSVQTTISAELESPAGTVAQVRAVAHALAKAAKPTDTSVLLIGHVTKEGSLAGPKVLEHVVDAVLTLESDSSRQYRILRASKNRFGSTEEIGLFEMTSAGMLPVTDPSHLFLSDEESARVGSAVVSAVEGSRPLLFDLQGLVAPAGFGTSQRVARGLDNKRLAMLLAVVERKGGLSLSGHDVFLNITGGLSVFEPAIDLGAVLALASSHLDTAIPASTLIVGEVGLGGEIRAVSQLPRRLAEAAKLGFKAAVIPEANKDLSEGPKGLKLTSLRHVADALDWLRAC
jgi:DNA repair protein RadA/Sms